MGMCCMSCVGGFLEVKVKLGGKKKKFADTSYPSLLNYLPKKKVNEASYVC